MAQCSPLLKVFYAHPEDFKILTHKKKKAIGIDAATLAGEDDVSHNAPLYLEVAVMRPDRANAPDKWFVPHITHVNETLQSRVCLIPGFADECRDTIANAIGMENVSRMLKCRPASEMLKPRPYPPPEYHHRCIETVTHNLFQRLFKEVEGCILTYSLFKMVQWLFGEFIWNVSRAASDVGASHMITISVPRKKEAPFMQRLEISADLTQTEMRTVAYFCAVLARGSGFYIYNYEERCLVHKAPPEFIAMQISCVYYCEE